MSLSGSIYIVLIAFVLCLSASSSSSSPVPAIPGPSYEIPLNNFTDSESRARLVRCPAGRYLHNAETKKCEKCSAGRFSSPSNNNRSPDCAGPCQNGYFCPKGSKTSTAQPCGGVQLYCPEGGQRLVVEKGYYTTPLSDEFDYGSLINDTRIGEDSHIGFRRDKTSALNVRSSQTLCEVSFYCTGDGYRRSCAAAGKFGSTQGLETSECSGQCPLGYYCSPFEASPIECPSGTYGDVLGLQDKDCSGFCEFGFYCPAGSTSKTSVPCPAGRYGSTQGLKTSSCSESCDNDVDLNCIPKVCGGGYYCPLNSVRPNERQCGGDNVFCPVGSSVPTPVSAGYYSTASSISIPGAYHNDSDKNIRSSQTQCEPGTFCVAGVRRPCIAGRYSSIFGEINPNCEPCALGHYCKEESTSAIQTRCGDESVFCPLGSAIPVPVQDGFYSITTGHDTRSDEAICPIGSYCTRGIARLCPAGTYGGSPGLNTAKCDGECNAGFYCLQGSTSATQVACEAGRYGISGMGTSNCKGICSEGYYCPAASTAPEENTCGGDMVYCPRQSALPLSVTLGYYSTGGTALTRNNQEECTRVNANECPSNTRTILDDVMPTPIQVDVDYNIDPNKEYRFNHAYNQNPDEFPNGTTVNK